MGWLASAMPSPVPCSSRVTEVRSLPYAELCCLDDPRYYAALRLPPHCPRFRFGLIPGHASAAIDFAGRVREEWVAGRRGGRMAPFPARPRVTGHGLVARPARGRGVAFSVGIPSGCEADSTVPANPSLAPTC